MFSCSCVYTSPSFNPSFEDSAINFSTLTFWKSYVADNGSKGLCKGLAERQLAILVSEGKIGKRISLSCYADQDIKDIYENIKVTYTIHIEY